MKREVENNVRKCKRCQVKKILGPRSRAPMEISTTARKPLERSALDILGPTTVTNKGKPVQSDVPRLLNKVWCGRTDSDAGCWNCSAEFVRKIMLKFGIPGVVLTD